MHPWSPFWLSAMLDLEAGSFERGVAFWRGVTGFSLSPTRGARGEFATLLPPTGDDYLRVQRLDDGPGRVHLDVNVADPRAAADRAVGLGAAELADRGYVAMRSPGGFVFCFVAHPASVRPTPMTWPDGHHSMVYQVCLDLPRSSYDVEAAFWAGVFEASPEVLARRPEFAWLRPDRQLALDVLLQRTDDETGPVTAHLDLGTTDRDAEVARHLALGAVADPDEEFWTVLTDPTGRRYCVTTRDPATGRLT
ncbi:VOC family protein [Nocardioides sp.]|uniref:VOC family protein n=1 Tax=Nocardioides sp. TaxID=35761 RepID=UPI0035280017